MVTDVIKSHRGPPASIMSNSRLSKHGQVVSEYAGNFYYSENLNWAAQNLRLGRRLNIAALVFLVANFRYMFALN